MPLRGGALAPKSQRKGKVSIGLGIDLGDEINEQIDLILRHPDGTVERRRLDVDPDPPEGDGAA